MGAGDHVRQCIGEVEARAVRLYRRGASIISCEAVHCGQGVGAEDPALAHAQARLHNDPAGAFPEAARVQQHVASGSKK